MYYMSCFQDISEWTRDKTEQITVVLQHLVEHQLCESIAPFTLALSLVPMQAPPPPGQGRLCASVELRLLAL